MPHLVPGLPTTVACALLALGGALAPAIAAQSVPPQPTATTRRDSLGAEHAAVTEHVVIISVDGLRPDAIALYDATTIRRLMAEGSYSLHAWTIVPSVTLPSHLSMLTGQPPEVHGVVWNDDEIGRGTVQVPTVFGLAHARGLSTAAFFSKSKFRVLEAPGTLDHVGGPSRENELWMAEHTAHEIERYLRRARPNLLFIHIADPDYAGHMWGWMTGVYGRAVRSADKAVASVVAAADRAFGRGDYTVILTADHGGHGRTHGTADSTDTLIPWIIWGEGVRAGATLEQDPHTMDTAATALWLLAVPIPSDWAGVPVTAALLPDSSEMRGAAKRTAP